jgi:IS605 OrfB family transposase
MVSQFGKYVDIPDVRFSYGHEAILASLYSCMNRKNGDTEAGVPISYRFKHDEKGWQLFVSTPLQKPKKITYVGFGAIGVDINIDHLAVAETDRYGNCIKHKVIPLSLYGKDSYQIKAIIGDAVKEVITWCQEVKKPLVLEKLSFQDKKTTLREEASCKQARALSSFAYNRILQAMKSRGYRYGVEVVQVNPAYTSIIGRCKFADRYGLSIHESAALTIARRFQGVSENLPRHLEKIPDGKGGYVTLSLPERNRDKHVWTSWRHVQRKLRVALAGQIRATRRRSSGRPPPACCDAETTSDFAAETPAHESLAALLG